MCKEWTDVTGSGIEGNEMDGVCVAVIRERNMATGFWLGNLNERDNMEDTGLRGSETLK